MSLNKEIFFINLQSCWWKGSDDKKIGGKKTLWFLAFLKLNPAYAIVNCAASVVELVSRFF